ncbi:MAG: hypothetical protein J0L75_12105 [Spirochaetes bacterium]|nr:hypothetical protein [Spirochaetota bacterium]
MSNRGSRLAWFQKTALLAIGFASVYIGAQVPFSAQSEGLKYAGHAFVDGALALAFNPAMMSRSRVFDATFSSTPLPFQNHAETAAVLLPLGRWTMAFDLAFTFPGNLADQPLYRDGIQQGQLSFGDFAISGGASLALSRGLSVGFAAVQENHFFLNDYGFSTWVKGGVRYETRLFRRLPLRLGADLEKELVGNLSTALAGLEKGFRADVAGALAVPAIRSEFGIDLGMESGLTPGTNGAFFNSLGIGVEAFRDFYVTPRLSLRLPVFDKPFGLSAGLSLALPVKALRYELAYALVKDFSEDPVEGEFRHVFTLSLRGNVDLFSKVRRGDLAFPERALRFHELTRPERPSAPLTNGSLDLRVFVGLATVRAAGLESDPGDLAGFLAHAVESSLRGQEAVEVREAGAELTVAPSLSVKGEALSLRLDAYDASGTPLFARSYAADFAAPMEREDRVDRVRALAQGGRLELLGFGEPYHRRKNRETLSAFVREWERDFALFLAQEYLKPVTVTANLSRPILHLDEKPVGILGPEGLKLSLKPGLHVFRAVRRGYPDAVARQRIDAPAKVALQFPTQLYSVDVYPVLLAEKSGVELALGGKTRKLRKGQEAVFEEVLSTNRALSVSGFYGLRAIPLAIQSSLDHQVFLMPDFIENFREAGFWSICGEGAEFRPRFGPVGLELRGVKRAQGPRPLGVQTPPFQARDFQIELAASCEDAGQGYLALIGPQGKKWVLVLQRQKAWVESDYEAETAETRARALVDREAPLRVWKHEKTIEAFLGDERLSIGPFPEEGPLRIFVGVDAPVEGDSVQFSATELVFKHR